MAISTINQNGLNAPLTLTSPVLTTPNLGTPSAINLSNATGLPSAALPTGSVLQVVQGSLSGIVSNATATWVDTGLTATITPKFSNSKILVTVNHAGTRKITNNTSTGHRLLKNGTNILVFESISGYTGNTQEIATGSVTTTYLDSPATTSALIYKTQINSQNNLANCRINDYNGDAVLSFITLMEIAG